MPFTEQSQWLIGCFGASAVLVSTYPNSYFCSYWNITIGMLAASFTGVVVAQVVDSVFLASFLAFTFAMAIMCSLKAEHPPAGAVAILSAISADYQFLLFPVATGTIAVLLARLLSGYIFTKYDIKSESLKPNAKQQIKSDTADIFNLLENISSVVQEEENLDRVNKRVMTHICEYTDWPIGHAYVVETTDEGVIAKSSQVWYTDPSLPKNEISAFVAQSQKVVFTPGQGLVGKVLADKAPVVIADVTQLKQFLRAASARENGIKGCFTFPVVFNGEVRIVFEFFSRSTAQLDRNLLGILQFSAKQICTTLISHEHQVMMRKLADEFESDVQSLVNDSQNSNNLLSGVVNTSSQTILKIEHSVQDMQEAILYIARKVEESSVLIRSCESNMEDMRERMLLMSKAAHDTTIQ